MSPAYRRACPVCASSDVTAFAEIPQVPVHCNLLWPTRDQAIYASKGDIRLGFCAACGHVFNLAFDLRFVEYTQGYENSLHFSPLFQQYANSLAMELTERHRLHGKTIIEIGCGKGEFLKLLCKLGGNRGIGFDPSYIQETNTDPCGQEITFIPDFYSERYADYKADLLCCRQVLEHIANPLDFLTTIRRAVGNGGNTTLFFEVPNVLFMLRDLSIWNIIYEHFSYFSLSSLAHLFTSRGFAVCRLSRSYEDQFLCVEASSGGVENNGICETIEDRREVLQSVASFAEKYQQKIDTWHARLQNIGKVGQRAVVWGAGSKGVMFLNLLQGNGVEYVVDINPQKQGMYVAGTGQEIVSPNFLRTYRPDVIIVMNSIYQREILRITRGLGLEPDFEYA